MPFVLIGLGILGAAGVVAILIQRADGIAATTATGETTRTADPPGAPTTAFQTTSAAEMPSNTVAVDPMADEMPDRWAKSPAATTAPIGINNPEDPFLGMDTPDLRDRNLGYAVDDMAQASDDSPFEDDIVRATDVAQAPAAFNVGLVSGLLR